MPAVALTVAAGLSGWFVLTTAGSRWPVLVCWFMVALFASMMAYYGLRTSRQLESADPRRRFWTALGAGSAIFAAGE